jgi:hypothetical protein
MKTLRFLIFAVFVLSLALSAAPARASGQSLVYLPLVTRANPQVPVEIQAQREFQRLAPKLLAAQQSGQLVDFNPEFRAGILMLRLPGRADEAANAATRMFGRAVYSHVRDALQAVPRLAPARQIDTVINAHFYVALYDNCFDSYVPTNSHVIAILKDNANVVLAKVQFNEQDDGNANGYIWSCFDWSSYNEVVPGYKVTFKVFDGPGGTLLGTFTAAAPQTTFTSLNKTTAQVAGTGPAGKAFDLFWSQPRLNAAGTYASNTVSGTVSGARTWSGDVSAGRIRGGAYISLTLYQTTNVAFWRSIRVPYTYCVLGGNYCEIAGFPFQTLALNVTKGGTTYRFSGRANAWGWYWVNMYNNAGTPIRLSPGDKVQGTNVALYTQPLLSFNAFNFVNDVISGKAPANRFFDVYIDTYSHGGWWWYWRGSNATGNFSVDTTAQFDLVGTETSEAEIYYIDPVTGNGTDFTRAYAP